MSRRGFLLSALVIAGLVGIASLTADAQYYFGKNKVQYTQFEWQWMQTPHFDVYFYPEERKIAEVGAAMAEESFAVLERKFVHTPLKRIPLIFYSSPLFFQQTNTISQLLPEGVGGFMEFVKGRVVVPCNGSLPDFERVIRHELVHVFMYDKIITTLRRHNVYPIYGPPLWFTEGLAEYWSRGWDSEADMVMRDAVFSEQVVPIRGLWQIRGSFKMYKEGQSIVRFMAERYGEDKLALLFENWWRSDRFEENFQATMGEELSEFDEDWQYALKKHYFPRIEEGDMPGRAAEKLTSQGISVKPAVVPVIQDGAASLPRTDEGERGRPFSPSLPLSPSPPLHFVFLSNRTGYSNIYQQKLSGKEEQPELVVKGERTAEFESLHLFRSKLGVSCDGRLAFVSKSWEQDALYVWDLERHTQVRKWVFPALISMSSPSWSPDGKEIVLSGLSRRGQSDLYVVNVDRGGLLQITDDVYCDRDPDWSPDGARIAFSSDRGADGEAGFRNLFVYDVKDQSIRPLTWGAHNDVAPSWSPDGTRIAFSSDREGAFNLYLTDGISHKDTKTPRKGQGARGKGQGARGKVFLEPRPLSLVPEGSSCLSGNGQGRVWPVTRVLTGAFDPDWLPDGKGLLFTAFERYAFGICRMALEEGQLHAPEGAIAALPGAQSQTTTWEPETVSGEVVRKAVRYKRRFGLDIAQSQIANDPEVGMSGGVQLAITDMLGDHRYYVLLSNTGGTKEEMLKNFNAALSRMDLSRQMNWAAGLFHLSDRYFNRYEGDFRERRYGGYLSIRYPFSKFRRVEGSLVLRNSDKHWYAGRKRKALLLSQFVGYTVDTSLWGPVGPIDGWRYNVTLGYTLNPRRGDIHYVTALADWRHYLRISARSSFAVRLLGRSSWGKEAQWFYMGGSWTLRGYDRASLWGRHLVLWNNELRFPLIDNLLIRFPFGALGFRAIRGALFVDVGNAWTSSWDGLLGSFGIGVRVRVADVLVLRLDLAKRMDSHRVGGRTHSEFFFGWSY